MNNTSQKLGQMSIISRTGMETAFSAFFAEVCEYLVDKEGNDISIDKKRISQMRIAINEICGNAIEHAHKKDKTKLVTGEIYQTDDYLEVIIQDEGDRTYKPEAIPTKEEIEKKIETAGRRTKQNRGMGTYLAAYFSDRVTFEPNQPTGTKVTLQMNLHTKEQN